MKKITIACTACGARLERRAQAIRHSEITGHVVEVATTTKESIDRSGRVPAVIARLDNLGVSPKAGGPAARKALRGAGVRTSNEVIAVAIRRRRDIHSSS